MPGNDRGRPGKSGPHVESVNDRPSLAAAADLRRRRDAADRLPPLECGRHRDPLEHYRREGSRLALHVYPRPERYSVVRGRVRQLVEGTAIRAHWSAPDRGWLLRSDRISDVLALAEMDGGYFVVVHEGEQVTR